MKLYAIGNSINPKNFNQVNADKLNDNLEEILVFKTKKQAEAQAKKMGTKTKQVPVFEIEVSDKVKFDRLKKNDEGFTVYDGKYDIVSASLQHFNKKIDVVTFEDEEIVEEASNDAENKEEAAEDNDADKDADKDEEAKDENEEEAEQGFFAKVRAFPGKVKAKFVEAPTWAKWSGAVGVASAAVGLLGGAPIVLAIAAKMGITATLSPVTTVVASLVGGAATAVAGFLGYKGSVAAVKGVQTGYAAAKEYFRKRSDKEQYAAELAGNVQKYHVAIDRLYGEKAKPADKKFVEALADMINTAPEKGFKTDGSVNARPAKNNKVVVIDFARKAVEAAAAQADAKARAKVEKEQLAEATKLGFKK